MIRPSSVAGRWSAISGAGITLIGIVLLLMPIQGRASAIPLAGTALLLAGLLELLTGLKGSRAPVRQISTVLAIVTLLGALLILVRPEAYPLTFVAIVCLAVRGVGAVVAAFFSSRLVRPWVLGRGVVDILLTAILIAGAPLAAVITVIAGSRWPKGGAEILTNFVAVSILATGLSLLGVALWSRRSAHVSEAATPRE
jgi:uncharacterized membrane protein HdeD (DUF308 family)